MNFSVIQHDKLVSHIEKDLHVLDQDLSIALINNEKNTVVFNIKKGAMCDGLSIPWGFRWFLPTWDENNELYNIAGLLHDALYASELVCKDIADDIFRGILRDAGISRFKASTAEWCVQTFAKCHYGKKHDKYGLGNYIDIVSISTL